MVRSPGSHPEPLVAAHVPRDHPVVTRDYSLYTLAIHDMVERIAIWLHDQVDGATIFGPSRFGKSNAVDHWLQRLLAERYGGYIPLVIWSHTDSGGAPRSNARPCSSSVGSNSPRKAAVAFSY